MASCFTKNSNEAGTSHYHQGFRAFGVIFEIIGTLGGGVLFASLILSPTPPTGNKFIELFCNNDAVVCREIALLASRNQIVKRFIFLALASLTTPLIALTPKHNLEVLFLDIKKELKERNLPTVLKNAERMHRRCGRRDWQNVSFAIKNTDSFNVPNVTSPLSLTLTEITMALRKQFLGDTQSEPRIAERFEDYFRELLNDEVFVDADLLKICALGCGVRSLVKPNMLHKGLPPTRTHDADIFLERRINPGTRKRCMHRSCAGHAAFWKKVRFADRAAIRRAASLSAFYSWN